MGFRDIAARAKPDRRWPVLAAAGLWAATGVTLAASAVLSPASAQPFDVTNGADSGAGSLRQAITSANAAAGPVTIDFEHAGAITLTSALPAITQNVTMENTSGGAVTVSGGGSPTFFTVSSGTLSLEASGDTLTRSIGVDANGGYNIAATTADSIQTLSGTGTVQLGHSTLTILNGSTTFSGAIGDGGEGGRVAIKGGVQTLDGGNTYSGGTRLEGGTLVVGGPLALGTGQLAIAGGATFGVAQFANLTFANAVKLTGGVATVNLPAISILTLSGTVSGPGALSTAGDGALFLTAADTYSGGTTVGSQIVLQVGDGGTAGSIKGNVVDQGVLAFDRSNTITFGGAISGAGGLEKDGGGELILTGSSTYSGGTTVISGTLGVGNSAALGAGVVTMQQNTTLAFTAKGVVLPNQIVFTNEDPTIDTGAFNATITGVISGVGDLQKTGSGALTLTADETYAGKTTVAAGTLIVDGSIASSPLTLDSGTTLGGSGTVGSVTVASGVTLAPGAMTPFSALHVSGDIGFSTGSTYVVNINPAGQTNSVLVTGNAKISGGVVDVLAANGVYSTTRYTILTARGGVAGTFGSLTTTSNLAFLTPTLSYSAKDVFLTLTAIAPPGGTPSFPSVAITPNQVATARAVQAQGAGAPLYDVILGQSVAGARAAFDALSGEIHPSAASAAFDDSRLPREAVLDRLSSPYGSLDSGGATGFAAMNAIVAPSLPANVFAAWGQAFGSSGHIGGDGNAATLDRSLGGFIVGGDATLDNRYRLGVAAGYTQSTLSVDARSSSGSIDSTFAGLYGGASFNALQLRAGALYAYNRFGTDRTIAFPGFGDTASAGYGGDTLQAFGEAGWRMPLSGLAGPASIEPFVGALAMHIDTASFAESGGSSALSGASQGYDYGATTLGIRGEATMFSNVPLLARGLLGWRHVFGDVTPASTLAFESAPSIPFSIAGAPIAQDALMIEAGFDWRLTRNATFGVYYSGALAVRDEDNAIKGKFEVVF